MNTIGDVTSQDEEADMSARSRMVIYEAQVKMFFDYPFGAGHRGTAALSPKYMDSRWLAASADGSEAERSSHNTFMTTLVEQGIPGGLMFSGLILWLLGAIWRLRGWNRALDDPELTTLAAAILGSIAVVLVAGMATDYLMAEVQFWMFSAAICAIQLRQALVAPAPHRALPAVLVPRRA
jgi:O-antigen ligase